jgi:hypothetical protein
LDTSRELRKTRPSALKLALKLEQFVAIEKIKELQGGKKYSVVGLK